ncbi:hypothetical protein CTI12_AA364140 [Artemisia annua]|uniref:CCHC-type domain-containing protein n=1 Tax=Artemisia annua TaxID=35608 RepID=A0A2U1MEQ5_ARTAN|nr:hypothetical protein CTI12_AA364140 [Artemisia annua]
MAGDDVNNDRVEQLENSFKRLEETIQKSLQQITQTIAGLTTHENEDQPVFGVPRRPNRGRGNGRHQRQPFQQHNFGGEDSDVEDEYEDEREVRGRRFEIQDRISLVPVYTLDDAYNLAIRAENQLAKNNRSTLFPSTNRNKFVSNAGQSTSKPEGSESVQKLSTLDTGKPTGTLVSKSTSTNPYARPVIGKCFKCGAPGHRSSECRATGGKVNLTTREDDYDEGEEERFDEEIETDVCHPADELDGDGEYSSKLCVVRRIMLAPKLVEKTQRHNLFRTRCVIHQRVLVPLIDNNKSKDSEETRNNMMILNHGDFNDQIKGESVIYAVVATGTIQEDPKKPTDETRRTRQTPTIMFEKQCKSGMDKFKAPSDVANGTPDYPAKAESLTLQLVLVSKLEQNQKGVYTLLFLKLGYSHEVELTVPPAVRVFCFKPNIVCCSGIDKQRVHQFAAAVRSCKPPEPYKGKVYEYKTPLNHKAK